MLVQVKGVVFLIVIVGGTVFCVTLIVVMFEHPSEALETINEYMPAELTLML